MLRQKIQRSAKFAKRFGPLPRLKHQNRSLSDHGRKGARLPARNVAISKNDRLATSTEKRIDFGPDNHVEVPTKMEGVTALTQVDTKVFCHGFG